jgi:hypothetical protein
MQMLLVPQDLCEQLRDAALVVIVMDSTTPGFTEKCSRSMKLAERG